MRFSIEPKEIFKSITQHKLRNALTGFGIAWGIFILMLMMGFGDSFQKGMFSVFSGFAENTVILFTGKTSMPYRGENEGKEIKFSREFIDRLKKNFSEIEYASPEASSPEMMKLVYEENFTMGNLVGVDKDYFQVKKQKLKEGRLFNPHDFEQDQPICIISENLEKILFKKKSKPIGKYLNIGDNYFKVVGVTKSSSMFDFGDRSSVIIPFNHFQTLFGTNTFSQVMISLNKNTNNELFNKQLEAFAARFFGYHPEDSKALYIYSMSDSVKEFQALFSGIKIFIWFVGFCILLTGIISVGNIMYVNINERIREIGIRKAIGATPRNILEMILAEAILLTSIAGLVGMFCGYLVIQIIKLVILSMAPDNMFLAHVGINAPIVLGSFTMLIIAGVIAGILPALKASKIKPVIALNQEN